MSAGRTPEEREAARREREARRAARRGKARPSEPPPPAREEDPRVTEERLAEERFVEDPRVQDERFVVEDQRVAEDPRVQDEGSGVEDPRGQDAEFVVEDQRVVEGPRVGEEPFGEDERYADEPHDHEPLDDEPARDEPDARDPREDDREVPLGTRRVARRPPPPRAAARPARGFRPVRLVAAGALLLVLVTVWFLVSLLQPGKGGGEGDVALTVPRGADAGEVGDLLADRGVVSSGFFFSLRASLSGRGEELRPGPFTLRRDMSYAAALDRLTAPPPPPAPARTVDLVVPEGRSIREEAAKLRSARIRGDYAAEARRTGLLPLRRYGAPPGTRTLEGFLFPATYELRRPPTARALVAKQAQAFRANIGRVKLGFARSRNLTVYDVLIIASMVEREAQVARERPVIAGVIYNRLRDGIPLQLDATTRYALNNWTKPLTDADFPRSGAYDTRNRLGLPPTPIGSPGLSSIRAAARPARTPFLYYVAKPGTCGRHAFARTLTAHNANVARYEEARAAAGGRSPDTCR